MTCEMFRMLSTPEKMALFCATMAETCRVDKSCAAAEIDRKTAYNWRNSNPAFAQAWDEAKQIGVTALEDECARRAFEGVDKPVFHKGDVCGGVREYSDTLAIFLLKGANPDKYRERSSVDLQGNLNVTSMTDEEILAELAAYRASGILPPEPDDAMGLA